MATLRASTLGTPVGPLSAAVDGDGVLLACLFAAVEGLPARLGADVVPVADLGPVTRALAAYLSGDLDALDALAVSQPGTAHQQAVWGALREVPAGTTVTYGELTARLGLVPGAARAVGAACGANTIAPVVPCHRVVAAGGGLGGYSGGLGVKRWLLGHEAGQPPLL